MGRPLNDLNPRIRTLWLKFKESGVCPKCEFWDVSIRIVSSIPKQRPAFFKYHCNLCLTEWADPEALSQVSVKHRIRVK